MMRVLLPVLIAVITLSGLRSVHGQLLSPVVDSIPMRDGKKLLADVYLPAPNDTFPVILVQTPYNRLAYRFTEVPLFVYQVSAMSYAMVIVDWRCFYGSASACATGAKRGEDGYDAVEWIAAQPWCNGKVGTWGPSALGKVQYQTAREQPPHLVCGVPLVAGSQFNYQEYFPGGAARTEFIEQLDGLGFGLSTFLYANTVHNFAWTIAENDSWYPNQIAVPMLLIGGWYDHNVTVMLDLFTGLHSQSPPAVRNDHRLLMGPWAHGGFGPTHVGSSQQGELFYPAAEGWSDSLAIRFFDYWLRNVPNGWGSSPVVQYFQTGENQWQNAPQFPPTGVTDDTLFLHQNGSLLTNPPSTSGTFSTISYDPRDPSPTYGGATLRQDLLQGPYDQSDTVESRQDVLLFTSPFIGQAIEFKRAV